MNFDWGTGSPSGLPADYFSIRWTGYVQPLFSETYYFCLYHNDIGRVWVNNQLLFDVNDPNGVENCGTYTMTAGTKYSIKVEFVENVGSAGVRLSWYSPTQYKQIIPASQLFPASPTPTPTITLTPTKTNTPTKTSTPTSTATITVPSGQVWHYYYYAGGQRVAMRVQGDPNPTNNGVFYTLGDQLGSTSVVTDASGNKVGEMRYMPWGEDRYTNGTTPTDHKYTGQRQDAGIGLYYYNARWYDPQLGRFTQADTLNGKGVEGLDRYAYVKNSPIGFSDPSGHEGCGDIPFGGARDNCFAASRFSRGASILTSGDPGEMRMLLLAFAGVTLDGDMTQWTLETVQAVWDAVYDIGARLKQIYSQLAGLSNMAAFKAVFGAVEITWGNGGTQGESETCYNAENVMCTTALRPGQGGHINIKGPSSLWINMYNFQLNIIHELGHVLWNEYSLVFGYEKAGAFSRDLLEPNPKTGLTMQQHPCPSQDCNEEAEIFADMFIAWVYDAWNEPPVEDVARADEWMNHMLPFVPYR